MKARKKIANDDFPLFSKSDYELIKKLLDKLTLEQRLIIEMHFWERQSMTEIADFLNLTWVEITQEITTALARLKSLCEKSPEFSRFIKK